MDKAINGLCEQNFLTAYGETQKQLVVAAHIQVFDDVADCDGSGDYHRENGCEHEEFEAQVGTLDEHIGEEVNTRNENCINRNRENHVDGFHNFVFYAHFDL